jgi:hypothetical protein
VFPEVRCITTANPISQMKVIWYFVSGNPKRPMVPLNLPLDLEYQNDSLSVKKHKFLRNITGTSIQRSRLAASPKISQRGLVQRLARLGVTSNRSQIAKIEAGDRPVLDYELAAIAKALKVSVETLFQESVP